MQVSQVRTRAKGIDKLFDFAKNATNIQDLAIVYNTTPEDVQTLTECIGLIFPKERIRLAKLEPALGVHGGPGILFIAFRERG